MRRFGVEEELLVVAEDDLEPLPVAEEMVRWHTIRSLDADDGAITAPATHVGPLLSADLHQEHVTVALPAVETLTEQLESIRRGRTLADETARRFGGRVVAVGSPPWSRRPHVSADPRHEEMGKRFGSFSFDQLTCGLHVRVDVDGPEEGVAVLDRIRIWLPTLLAMSANSPYWFGRDTGFASHRHQSWSQWPTAGIPDVFGSVAEYRRRCESLVEIGAALDRAQLHLDAHLGVDGTCVVVRVTDVCLDARHAAVLAVIVRALVETTARMWRLGVEPPPFGTAELRAAAWHAARYGLQESLVSPKSMRPVAAGDVIAEMLRLVRPTLREYGEEDAVDAVVWDMLRVGTGATRQRDGFAIRKQLRDVVKGAIHVTHLREEIPAGGREPAPGTSPDQALSIASPSAPRIS